MGNSTSSWEFFLFLSLLIYLLALGLCCCTQAFSSCSSQGFLFLGVLRLLIAVVSLAQALGVQVSVVVSHGLSCPLACRIFLDQESNPSHLRCQVDSHPPRPQGSPWEFLRRKKGNIGQGMRVAFRASLVPLVVKESACNAEALGSIPGSVRFPGEGNGSPLQQSFLENLMDRGAWWTYSPCGCILPGESHGQRSLVEYKELDLTK